jgi:hypothetical protein
LDDGYDGVQYQRDFYVPPATEASDGSPAPAGPTLPAPGAPKSRTPDGWHIIDLPFNAFVPNFRGRPVSGRPPLAASQIRQLGVMVSKFGAADGGLTPGFHNGAFKLRLRSLSAYA